jgi:hypothetical protein
MRDEPFSGPVAIAEEGSNYLKESRRALDDYGEVSGDLPPWASASFQARSGAS